MQEKFTVKKQRYTVWIEISTTQVWNIPKVHFKLSFCWYIEYWFSEEIRLSWVETQEKIIFNYIKILYATCTKSK